MARSTAIPSQPDKGSLFYFTITAPFEHGCKAEQINSIQSTALVDDAKKIMDQKFVLSGKTPVILVAEDRARRGGNSPGVVPQRLLSQIGPGNFQSLWFAFWYASGCGQGQGC
jgi:hypothetical protein